MATAIASRSVKGIQVKFSKVTAVYNYVAKYS